MKEKFVAVKFIPKGWVLLLFYALLAANFYVFYGRNHPSTRFNFYPFNLPEFYSHVSNFVISYLLLSAVGVIWLMLGAPTKLYIAAGLVLIILNFIVECFISILNTPDIIDAYFGLAGVVLALLFIFLVKGFGLKEKEPSDSFSHSGS